MRAAARGRCGLTWRPLGGAPLAARRGARRGGKQPPAAARCGPSAAISEVGCGLTAPAASVKMPGFAVYSLAQGRREPRGFGRARGLLWWYPLRPSPEVREAGSLALRVSRERPGHVSWADLMVQK